VEGAVNRSEVALQILKALEDDTAPLARLIMSLTLTNAAHSKNIRSTSGL